MPIAALARTAFSAFVTLLAILPPPAHCQPVEVSLRQNVPASANDQTGGTSIRFEDYVSNPKPGQAEPTQGLVAVVPSPFTGLITPDAKLTSRSPLPPPIGLRIESSSKTLSFQDVTNNAVCSDLRADQLTLRFVDPTDADIGAEVSTLSLALVGTSVQAGKVRISAFDVSNQPLLEVTLAPISSKKFRNDVQLVARRGGQPFAAIHRVTIEKLDDGYFVLGAGMDVKDADLRFSGFAVAGSAVLPEPEIAPPKSHQAQWSRYGDAARITDLREVTPASALAERRLRGKWKVFEYETPTFSGYALAVTPESEAPEVTVPLKKTGWHAVYIGLSTINNFGKPIVNRVKARLTGDHAFAYFANNLDFSNDGTTRRDRIEEVHFGSVDLTGQDLVIGGVINQHALVTHVKLIPLTEEEVQRVQEERKRTGTRNLVATFDGHSMIWPYHPRTAQDVANTFTAFADSDFGTWWFQPGGADMVNYKSDYGTIIGETLEVFPRPIADRAFTESILALNKNGVNVAKVAIDEAHKQNTEILIFSRIGGWKGGPPWEEMFTSRFYEENPQWRTVDRDGTPVMYMSYAYPEVQDHVVDVLREAVEFGADGAGVFFHRGMPMMLWERGFVDRFAAEYPGVDARQIAEDDPRLYAMRAQIVTEYLQKIRRMLDEVAAERGDGKRLKLGVSTFATKADNDKFGLDVERWITEGLLDQIGTAWFAYHTSGLAAKKADVEYYARLTQGTETQLFPFVIGWQMSKPEILLKTASEMYAQGADGIAVWDPDPISRWSEAQGAYWPLLKNLGHREQLTDGSLVYEPVSIPVTRLGDNHYSRWQPNTGF